jgi:hypothetical protein
LHFIHTNSKIRKPVSSLFVGKGGLRQARSGVLCLNHRSANGRAGWIRDCTQNRGRRLRLDRWNAESTSDQKQTAGPLLSDFLHGRSFFPSEIWAVKDYADMIQNVAAQDSDFLINEQELSAKYLSEQNEFGLHRFRHAARAIKSNEFILRCGTFRANQRPISEST